MYCGDGGDDDDDDYDEPGDGTVAMAVVRAGDARPFCAPFLKRAATEENCSQRMEEQEQKKKKREKKRKWEPRGFFSSVAALIEGEKKPRN